MNRLAPLFLFIASSAGAALPRYVENLDRGLVAVRLSASQVFLSWRMLGTEPDSVTYNVYRGGAKITASPITLTNYTDTAAGAAASYEVRPVISGVEGAGGEASVWGQPYLSIPLQQPAGGTSPDAVAYTYTPNDCSVGDLDGDGDYEIVVKWDPSNSKDNSQSGYTGSQVLDAYRLDGTRLWRVDLGINIRSGAHYTQFQVYDFDSDGRAELMCKTAPGSRDGSGAFLGMGPAASDNDGSDYRNASGYVLSGPEYLTVFNGLTGREMSTVNYAPQRGTVSAWGDNYGNRVDRFLAGVAYLDGQRPSAIFARGYYPGQSGQGPGRTVVAAWDWRGGALTQRWAFDTNSAGQDIYIGKGNHQLSVADVDSDGRDDIVYGALTVDDNGAARYAATWGHSDALHVADIVPSSPGLEIWTPDEWSSLVVANGRPGCALRRASDGAVLWSKLPGSEDQDVGRAMTADITAAYPGMECWAAGGLGIYRSDTGAQIAGSIPSINFAAWWDGDLLRELLDGNTISKFGGGALLTATGCASNNGSKSTPGLSGDILGDWREEVIFRTTDNSSLRLFTTTLASSYRLRTLMHDPQYRVAVAWQNTAYNQPPHTSFFLGEGMGTPPTPNIVLVGGAGPPTATRTPTPGPPPPTATRTRTPTRSATATPPAPTATPSRSASPTPSRTRSPSPSRTATSSSTATPPAATATPSRTATTSPSLTGTGSPTRTASPSGTPSPTRTATPSPTPTPSGSPTRTPTQTQSQTRTPASPSFSPSESRSPSSTRSATSTWTASPSPTATRSATATPSPTRTATPSTTSSASPSRTPTSPDTATASPTPSPSFSATLWASPSRSRTPSRTAAGSATESATPSATLTATPSLTSSSTRTATPSFSRTPSPTPTSNSTVPVPTATASPSRTSVAPTLSSSPSPTAPVPSVTGSPSPVPPASATLALGPPAIERAVAVPNPNPGAIALRLSGRAEKVALRIWSVGMRLLLELEAGPAGPGWVQIPLPASFLSGASGTYFYSAQASRGEERSRRVLGRFMVLR